MLLFKVKDILLLKKLIFLLERISGFLLKNEKLDIRHLIDYIKTSILYLTFYPFFTILF